MCTSPGRSWAQSVENRHAERRFRTEIIDSSPDSHLNPGQPRSDDKDSTTTDRGLAVSDRPPSDSRQRWQQTVAISSNHRPHSSTALINCDNQDQAISKKRSKETDQTSSNRLAPLQNTQSSIPSQGSIQDTESTLRLDCDAINRQRPIQPANKGFTSRENPGGTPRVSQWSTTSDPQRTPNTSEQLKLSTCIIICTQRDSGVLLRRLRGTSQGTPSESQADSDRGHVT